MTDIPLSRPTESRWNHRKITFATPSMRQLRGAVTVIGRDAPQIRSTTVSTLPLVCGSVVKRTCPYSHQNICLSPVSRYFHFARGSLVPRLARYLLWEFLDWPWNVARSPWPSSRSPGIGKCVNIDAFDRFRRTFCWQVNAVNAFRDLKCSLPLDRSCQGFN